MAYRDPKSQTIGDWRWRPLSKVRKELELSEIPSHVEKFGEFMDETARRAAMQGLTPRDLIKAYTLTRFSIQRTARTAAKLRKSGLVLPPTITDDTRIRPEGAFGQWLHTKHGQKYLDEAEAGRVNDEAVADAQAKLRTFGKVDRDLPDALRWAAKNLPGQEGRVSELVGRAWRGQSTPEEWRHEMSGLRGIRSAKAGFIAAQLGRGDQPTLDARQLVLNTGQPSKAATPFLRRQAGLGASEAVQRLAARQTAMGLKLPSELKPHYQHLAHHAIWDAAEGEQTTHQDVIDALRTAKTGGRIAAATGRSIKLPTAEDIIRAMKFAGFPAMEEAHRLARDNPKKFKNLVEGVTSPYSTDPENRKRAADIAESYKIPLTGRLMRDSAYYNINQPVDPQRVTANVDPLPGAPLKPKRFMSWEDLHREGAGGTMINLGGDRSRSGVLTHIMGRKTAWPVNLYAGPEFMREYNRRQVWASAPTASSQLLNLTREASKNNKPVYGAYSPMGVQASDSAHHMFDALMAQVPNSGIDPKAAAKFDRALKSGEHILGVSDNDKRDRARAKETMKKWPGLLNAKEASNFAKGLTGKHRAAIVKFMDKAPWLEAGLPAVGVTRVALSDPEVWGTPGNMIGHRVVRLDPDYVPSEGSGKYPHTTYKAPTGGEYVGELPPVERQHAMPDPMIKRAQLPAKGNRLVHPYSDDPMGRSTTRKMFEENKQSQEMSQQWLDNIRRGQEGEKGLGLADGGRVRRAMGGPVDDDTRKWFGDSKVVDAQGEPLIVYRGEHGANSDSTTFHTKTPRSISFGDRTAGNVYATDPNDSRQEAEAPRMLPAYLKIRKPVIHSPDDPFVELGDIEQKLGRAEATRLALEHASHIYNTNNWNEEIDAHREYGDVKTYLAKHPDGLKNLYLDAYPVLDDPKFVRAAVAKGYDGAIHIGNGETATDLEYRIFHPKQARSAISPHLGWRRQRADGGPVEDGIQLTYPPEVEADLARLPAPGIGHNQPPTEGLPNPSPSYIKPVDENVRRLSPLGLYSHAAEAVWKQPQMKASPQQFKNTLINKHGVKPDEFKWSGYDEAFKDRTSVSKREVRDHFIKHMPKIRESVKQDEVNEHGEPYQRHPDDDSWAETKYSDYQLPGAKNYREIVLHLPKDRHPDLPAARQAHREAIEARGEAAKEKVRASAAANEMFSRARAGAGDGDFDAARERAEAARRVHVDASEHVEKTAARIVELNRQNTYKSTHWDEENPLLHLRISDRDGPMVTKYQWRNRLSGNGTKTFDSEDEARQHLATLPEHLRPNLELKKLQRAMRILHVEEMQSDWGQDARDRGLKSETDAKRLEVHAAERAAMVARQQNRPDAAELTRIAEELLRKHGDLAEGVAPAPYIDNTTKWTELGLKRILHEAVKGNYDRIVFTPGEEQAKRYDLSKQVKELRYHPDTKYLLALGHGEGDHEVAAHENVEPADLHKYVGKETAEKILARPLTTHQGRLKVVDYHGLSGSDLSVGGEGMKGYYDKIVPKAFEKLARQHDPDARVKMHSHELPTDMAPRGSSLTHDQTQALFKHHDISPQFWDTLTRAQKTELKNEFFRDNPGTVKGHAIDITPKMKASIARGQRAYADGGKVDQPDAIANKYADENDLLQPIGMSKTVGKETPLFDEGVHKAAVADQSGSNNRRSIRYLYHDDEGSPIGAMQIGTHGPRTRKATIQNVYVADHARRQGIASKILKRARQDFDVRHSDDLTKSGKAFARAVKADGGPVEGPVDPTVTDMFHVDPAHITPAVDRDDYVRRLSPIGLYSHAAEAVWKQPQMKASPEQFKNTLINKHGVKPDEFKWSGYDKAFAGRSSVSKREVRDHFQQNMPQVQESVRKESDYSYDDDDINQAIGQASRAPKYGQWQLPGGHNYREVLLHLPSEPSEADIRARFLEMMSAEGFGPGVEATQRERNQIYEAARRSVQHDMNSRQFSHMHWDVPNILAHLRLSDRTEDPPGARWQVERSGGTWKPLKILHVEELQSDWGQEGHKQGFKDPLTPEEQQEWDALRPTGGKNLTPEQNTRWHYLINKDYAAKNGVPKGPFIDTTDKWTDLALKRVMHEAAVGGYDKIVFTSGRDQADRYSLAKHIRKIEAMKVPDSYAGPPTHPYYIDAINHEGESIHSKHHSAEELPDVVGAELAKRIIAETDKAPDRHHIYNNLDLNVGGEGMKAYYDKMVPKRLEKLARMHDPKADVKLHGYRMLKGDQGATGTEVMNEMGVDPAAQDTYWRALTSEMRDQHFAEYRRRKSGDTYGLHELDVTPKMRASILQGQRGFARGGAVNHFNDRINDQIYRRIHKAVDIAGRYPGSMPS